MAKATPGWPDNGRPSRRRLDAQHTSQRRLELELTRCPARCVSQRVAAAPEAHRDDGLPRPERLALVPARPFRAAGDVPGRARKRGRPPDSLASVLHR